jgi:hypothetical protein
MADMLATTDDLYTLVGETPDTLPLVQATELLELATGEVQAAADQRIVAVADDQITLMGTTGSWLPLPQRPVTDVTLVEVDGEAVTDFKRFGARLWRSCGWSAYIYEPSTVSVTYSHGYASDAQELEYARKLALRMAAHMFTNPDQATGFSIDDYREQFSQGGDQAGDLLPKRTQRLLRRTYGARSGLVRVG